MNILPKKSWHVRNKDNVERVRRDEAKALEEERECARRRALAEQEARIQILRQKAVLIKAAEKEAQWDLPQEPGAVDEDETQEQTDVTEEETYVPLNTAFPSDQHINLFEDFEHKKKSQGSNKEYELEKKKAQEDYEKKIGYLTYLGQSAPEALGEKPWYEKVPDRKDTKVRVTYSQEETIQASDPLLSMKMYLDEKKRTEEDFQTGGKKSPEKSVRKDRARNERRNDRDSKRKVSTSRHDKDDDRRHKHKKDKKHKKYRHKSSDSEEPTEKKAKSKMEELREARMAREAKERQRSLDLVAQFQGVHSPARSVIDERTLGYNSVYNTKLKPRR